MLCLTLNRNGTHSKKTVVIISYRKGYAHMSLKMFEAVRAARSNHTIKI